jgi:hypothetical protein
MTHARLQSKFAVVLLALLALTQPLSAASGNGAQIAFHKLQSLAGEWEGKTQQGARVRSYFSAIASNTAVMERVTTGREDAVSLYSVTANSILLIRYCASNHQPRMRAVPSPGPVQELAFSFAGADNLPSLAVGHERRLVIEFEDDDHITERWTWRRDGKDTDTVFHLSRLHLSRN